MKLEGRIWKSRSSKHWLAEVPDLDLVTQGKSRKDAGAMLADAVACLVSGGGFKVGVSVGRDGACSVTSNDDVRLAALVVRRLRARNGAARAKRRTA
jgi:hypothetical protein